MKKLTSQKASIHFIILLGIVSLFADMTYEGARSINGQYLSVLGASGAIVGIVAGFGECIGYFFRLLFGYWSDRTERYWIFTFVGYFINLIAVPLMAYATGWQWASLLIILERFGKAIRTPSRDAMLSYATKHTGRGFGFGMHEFLDRLGALSGPILMTMLLLRHDSYSNVYLWLGIPALLALTTLFTTSAFYQNPKHLEIKQAPAKKEKLSSVFWVYVVGSSLIAAGYVDFSLIAFHFQKVGTISFQWLPLYYATAMAVAAVSVLILGKLYDRSGLTVVILTFFISAFFAWFVFNNRSDLVLIGMVLWGLGIGAQGSIMRSFVADIVSPHKRATAYGALSAFYGVFWFLGSALLGFLYDISIPTLIVVSFLLQMCAIPLFIYVKRRQLAS